MGERIFLAMNKIRVGIRSSCGKIRSQNFFIRDLTVVTEILRKVNHEVGDSVKASYGVDAA